MVTNNDGVPCTPVTPVGPQRTEWPVFDPVIARVTIDGLRCVHCAARIRNALVTTPHVLGAEVKLQMGVAEILFDASGLSPAAIAAKISSAADGSPRHYEVTTFELTWPPGGAGSRW